MLGCCAWLVGSVVPPNNAVHACLHFQVVDFKHGQVQPVMVTRQGLLLALVEAWGGKGLLCAASAACCRPSAG